ncbi:MAG: FHA domain-containing protein [Anaerovoracaceae bacterium]|jgi:hypothetical protein
MEKAKEAYLVGYLIHIETGEKFELEYFQEYTIGRDDSNNPFHIFIDHGAVSRTHAVISYRSEGLYIEDKGSKNGTILNNQVLLKDVSYPIKNNDKLFIANVELLFQLNEEKESFIKLHTLCGRIEEIGGGRRFSIESNKIGILPYEKKMIEATDCPFILSMNFLHKKDQEEVFFDFTGFIPLTQYLTASERRIEEKAITYKNQQITEKSPIISAIELLGDLLSQVKGCEEYLLAYDRIPLSADTIFINEQKNKVAFAYIPAVAGNLSLQNKIISLLAELSALYNNQDVSTQLKRLEEDILNNNLGLDGIISALGLMEREINYSLWSRKEFVRDCQGFQDDKTANEEEEKQKSLTHFPNLKGINSKDKKILILQLVAILILTFVYISRLLEQLDFVGFFIIVVGIDIWLTRTIKNEKIQNH